MTIINTWPGWTMVRKIGAGSFGTVYEIETKEDGVIRKAALKVMSIPPSRADIQVLYDSGIATSQEEATTYINYQIETVSQEFRVMAALKGNPNIVSFENHMVLPHEGWPGADILIRMELLTPLNQYLRSHVMDEEEVIRLGMDICNALQTCHAMTPPILHRDIKAANVMVDDDHHFKLGDFGVARVMEGSKSAHTMAGTEDYMAPEVVQMTGYRATADLYSLGILLYRMLNNNRNPFLPTEGSLTAEIRNEARLKLLNGVPVPPPMNGSKDLYNVIRKVLSYDPKDRYQTAADFRAALEGCLPSNQVDSIDNTDEKTENAFSWNKDSIKPRKEREDTHPETDGGTVDAFIEYKDIDPPGEESQDEPEPPSGTSDPDNGQLSKGGGPPPPVDPVIVPPKGSKKPLIFVPLIILLIAAVMIIYRRSSGSASAPSGTAVPATDSTETATENQSVATAEQDGAMTTAESVGAEGSLTILSDTDCLLQGDRIELRLQSGSEILMGSSAPISWTSSDPEIARFDSNGVLEAISSGSVTITAEYKDLQTTSVVTVVAIEDSDRISIKADPSALIIARGNQKDVEIALSGDLPEHYCVSVYEEAGMFLSFEWGSLVDDSCTLSITDMYSQSTDGYFTILMGEGDSLDNVIAAIRVPVHIK